MGFLVQPDGTIRADTPEEALALARVLVVRSALGTPAAVPPPVRLNGQLRGMSGSVSRQRNRWRFTWSVGKQKFHGATFDTEGEAQRALDQTLKARAAGQALPTFPKRHQSPRACSKCGELGHDLRRCGKPARVRPLTEEERRATISGAMKKIWEERRVAIAAGRAAVAVPVVPAPPSDPAPERRPKFIPRRPIGRGSIQERDGRFRLIVSTGNATRFAGSFATKAEAEVAQEAIYQARLAGATVPTFRKLRCSRCGGDDHRREKCKTPEADLPPPLTKQRVSEEVRALRISEGLRRRWEKRRAEQSASDRSRAFVSEYRGGTFALRLTIDGKSKWGGTFTRREDADAACEAWRLAVAEGRPLPEFRVRQLQCSRCGGAGHNVTTCTNPERVRAPAPSRERPVRPTAPAPLARVEAAPGPVPAPKGSPENRQRLSDAVKSSWARRRAEKGTATPAGALRNVLAGRLPWSPAPARASAQLPPRCVRCFRVGHVEADCPRAAPEPILPISPPSIGVEKEEVSREPEPPYDGALLDDDDGTDLTDMVDVPDPPAQVVHASGPTLVTPPPPRELVHLPLVEDDGDDSYPDGIDRPLTRGDCKEMPRPCPFVSCSHHLYPVFVLGAQTRSPLSDCEPWQMPETCDLDVADRGGATLEEVGKITGVTRERIRQIEEKALKRAANNARIRRMDFETPVERGSNAAEDRAD
jgi:hypothetical protein